MDEAESAGTGRAVAPRAQAERYRLLTQAIQDLARARSLSEIAVIVRHASRELAGSDGATFVLRDGDRCHYFDEEAIAPLWKGLRFPLDACISGWVMLHRTPAVIEDIYADERVPHEAYRPTFVKSLAMIPVRSDAPVAAIGNYWAHEYRATEEDVEILQALANSTSVAMENVRVYEELEDRVRARTLQLEAANKELESFNYAVSHDLRAPLRAVEQFRALIARDYGHLLDDLGQHRMARMQAGTTRMEDLINALLGLSRLSRAAMNVGRVDLSAIARDVITALREQEPGRSVEVEVQEGVVAKADAQLMKIVLENLLGNAWKYSSKRDAPRIAFSVATEGNNVHCQVRDNGAGFDMGAASKLFGAFQRLHTASEFPGTGIGLATVARIINRHEGRLWAEAAVEQGATFHFVVPAWR